STKPASFKPWPNATPRFWNGASDVLRRNPTIGVAGRCARAARGHAMADPATTLMKSRRCIAAPRLRSTPIGTDYSRDLRCAEWDSGDQFVQQQSETAHVRFTPKSGH